MCLSFLLFVKFECFLYCIIVTAIRLLFTPGLVTVCNHVFPLTSKSVFLENNVRVVIQTSCEIRAGNDSLSIEKIGKISTSATTVITAIIICSF